MSELWWRTEAPGRERGPFTSDQIRELLANKSLKPDELLWSTDTRTWRVAARAVAVGDTEDRHLGRRLRGPLLLAAYAISLMDCIFLIDFRAVERITSDVAAVVWPVSGLAVMAASLGLAAAWLRPGELGVRRPELAAARSLAVGVLALAGLAAGSLTLYQRHDVVALLRATRTYTYELKVDPRGGTVRMQGYIGPGFTRDLARVLAARTAPKRLEIDSLGGLIGESLTAAKLVEASHMQVVVRAICASACVAVLLAGNERLADVNARIDFHATAPVAQLNNKAVLWSAQQQGNLFRAYLEARGAPKDLLDASARLGPSKVESVNSLEALDLRLVTGVVRGDTPLSRSELTRLLGRSPRRMVRPAVYTTDKVTPLE